MSNTYKTWSLFFIKFLHEIRTIQKDELNKTWLESVIQEL
jgi:hypothetical protein